MAKDKDATVAEAPKNRLVALIENATEEDLAELREETSATEKKLRGLKKMEGVVAAAFGKEEGKPGPKKEKTARSASRPDDETALLDKWKRIATFLDKSAKTGHDIITNCGIAPAQLADVMNHSWFSKQGNLYHLTPQARRDLY